MKKIVLKEDILDAIRLKENAILFGKIAYILGITPASLPRLLNSKHEKLTQAAVLRILKEDLGIKKDSELLEEMQEPEKKAVA